MHVHPPSWKKAPQKCPKEERKFRPDMSAKKNVHVPLRCDKIKTKKIGKKEKKNSKRKGIKLKNKERRQPFVGNRNYAVDFFHVYLPLLLF